MTLSTIRRSFFSRLTSICLMVTFGVTMVITPRAAFAVGVMGLPEPGEMVNLSPSYVPLMITGLTVHPENPLLMDFIVSTGNSGVKGTQVKEESQRLIKYFLACLTIPENNQWVNLSPYEKQRIVPEDLGQTVLGQDMLAQDYLLKQLTASLIYPEKNLGKNFWDKVYAQASQKYGTTQIPVNTFNKVWILPDTAKVYEHNNTVFVVKCHLKVMLDEDYLALNKHVSLRGSEATEAISNRTTNNLGSQVIRQIILPAIENEVNTGKNFAQLRQIYNSMILAFWYKNNLKQALLNQVYTNRSQVNGVKVDDPAIKQKIYEQYVQAYKKGVFNYIKEDVDQNSQQTIPRKYFSGGIRTITHEEKATGNEAMAVINGQTEEGSDTYDLKGLSVGIKPGSTGQSSAAMISDLREKGVPEIVLQNIEQGVITNEEHLRILGILAEIGEQNLLAKWSAPGSNDDHKRLFLDQMVALNKGYSGGLLGYKNNARKLLQASLLGKSVFEGFTPSVPQGDQFTQFDQQYATMENEGLRGFNKTAGVLVAGGVGDRLGFNGIKVGIPLDLVSMKTYLQHFIEDMLALQEKSNRLNGENRKVPLVIMTSDDTHEQTIKLLEENDFFGMDGLSVNPTREQVAQGDVKQIIILKQGMVPAMVDNDAKFVVDEHDPYKLQTKPHGHGDVHMLIKQVGLDEHWLKEGRTHTFFFQDTNGQVFNAVLVGLANSIRRKFALNFLTVPREAKEKTGSIVQMRHEDGQSQTINVEYNELDPMLKAAGNPNGDVPDPETGKSPYPANLNVFIVENNTYHQKLTETGGIFGEFINPKYTDATKTGFKAPTRSETMMQDYAKSLPGDLVGFTNFDKRNVFSPVKNDVGGAVTMVSNGNYPDSMSTGESDYYKGNRSRFAFAGVDVDVQGQERKSRGVPFNDGAKISYSPLFASTIEEVRSKVQGGRISSRSILSIDGENVELTNLRLDGTLIIKTAPGVYLTVNNLNIVNAGTEFVDLTEAELNDPGVPQFLKIRGYKMVQHDAKVIDIQKPGRYEIGSDGQLMSVMATNAAMATTGVKKSTDEKIDDIKKQVTQFVEGINQVLSPERAFSSWFEPAQGGWKITLFFDRTVKAYDDDSDLITKERNRLIGILGVNVEGFTFLKGLAGIFSKGGSNRAEAEINVSNEAMAAAAVPAHIDNEGIIDRKISRFLTHANNQRRVPAFELAYSLDFTPQKGGSVTLYFASNESERVVGTDLRLKYLREQRNELLVSLSKNRDFAFTNGFEGSIDMPQVDIIISNKTVTGADGAQWKIRDTGAINETRSVKYNRGSVERHIEMTLVGNKVHVIVDTEPVLVNFPSDLFRSSADNIFNEFIASNFAMSAAEAIGQVEKWATELGWDDTVVRNVKGWYETRAVSLKQWQAFIRIVEEGKADKIKAGFSSKLGVLQPGTAGTRGEMENLAEDKIGPNYFSATTVNQYTSSFVNWYKKTGQTGPVFITKEVRENSDTFGDVASKILLGNGIKVIRVDRPVSTPFASYLAKWLSTSKYGKPAFGYQISASHNKFADNGIKFMGPDGQQFMPDVMDPIAAGIPALAATSEVPLLDLATHPNYQVFTDDEFSQALNAYFDELDSTLAPDFKEMIHGLKASGKKFVFTPLNGASADETIAYLKRLGLTNGEDYLIPPDDMKLPTDLPAAVYGQRKLYNSDPAREGVLDSTIKFAEEHGIDMVFARDPDGDRLVLAIKVNGKWQKLDGNQNAIVMLHDRLSNSKDLEMSKMLIMRSHATTTLLDDIARSFGIKTVVTPVGFKYVGAKILEIFKGTKVGRYFFGAEESYGTSNGHINEKDGLSGLANMLVLIARQAQEGKNVLDYLNGLYMEYGYPGDVPNNIELPGKTKPEQDKQRENVKTALSQLEEGKTFAGYKIVSVSKEVKVAGLGQFHDGYDLILEDDAGKQFRLLFRASGTEPIFKAYFSWQNPIKSTNPTELQGVISYTNDYVKRVSQKLREAFIVMAGDRAMSINNQYVDSSEDWADPSTEVKVAPGDNNAAMRTRLSPEAERFFEGDWGQELIKGAAAWHGPRNYKVVDLMRSRLDEEIQRIRPEVWNSMDPEDQREMAREAKIWARNKAISGEALREHNRELRLSAKNAAMIIEPGEESRLLDRPSRMGNKYVTVVGAPKEEYTISIHPNHIADEDKLIVYGPNAERFESRTSTIPVLTSRGVFYVIDRGDGIIIKSERSASQLEFTDKAALVEPEPGGIDLNSRNLKMESFGQKVNITFDPAMIAQFRHGDFSGVRIQILDVVPINLMPLLGLKENEGSGQLA